MLPHIPELLYPHRLDKEVASSVCYATQNNAGLAIRGHHCRRRPKQAIIRASSTWQARDMTGVGVGGDGARTQFSSQAELTDDWQVHFQAHHLQQLEPVHVCIYQHAII